MKQPEASDRLIDPLVRSSVESILECQSPSGALIASPDFSQYPYCWLRDGSFIAYGLDRAGESAAARRYHDWVNRAIGPAGIGPGIDAAIAKHRAGDALAATEMPPARFCLDGSVVADDWPNFQIDGYGTWLWSLRQHLILSGTTVLPAEMRDSVERTARYVSAFAFSPCYDVWEENGDELHTSTLASVYAGLVAADELLGAGWFVGRAIEVRNQLHATAERVGVYPKSDAQPNVDASALWLGSPFGVVGGDDQRFVDTVAAIEGLLVLDGGIRRYDEDTYFGGGAWPVLTCSLGWHFARTGRLDDARRCLDWVAGRIDDEGRLGEQFGGDVRDPQHYREWVERWGKPAQDLLWSHAMLIILAAEIDECSHP